MTTGVAHLTDDLAGGPSALGLVMIGGGSGAIPRCERDERLPTALIAASS